MITSLALPSIFLPRLLSLLAFRQFKLYRWKRVLTNTICCASVTLPYYMMWRLGVECPYCGFADSKVIDSRDVNDGIRRRRECLSCRARFTTYERLQPAGLFVIKKDKRREEFSQDKLLSGVRKACEKRPLPTGAVDKLVEDIEARLYQSGKSEVPGSVIGDMVMAGLRKLDYIAYIRFASVYRDFADITDLKREVDTLLTDEVALPSKTSQLLLLPTEPQAGLTMGGRRRRR